MGRILILVFAIFCLSTSVIFIKKSEMPPGLMAGGRLLLAAAILSPLFLRDLRHVRREGIPVDFRQVLWPSFWMAIHFISWIYGARMIPAAHSSLIINLVPVVLPFMLMFLLREHLNRAEIAGTLCALTGGAILGFADYRYSPEHLPGDAICLLSMFFLTAYLALARRNRHFYSIWLYNTPLYLVAGLLCLLFAAPLEATRWAWPSGREWLLLLGLTLVPTVIGHTLLANMMRHLPGQTVALFNLGQFIFAGAMAVPIFSEFPRPSFYLASVLMVAGAGISILWRQAPANPPIAEVPATTEGANAATPTHD